MHLQRHKTDKADAKMIYEYGTIIVTKSIALWSPQSTRIQELQQCDSLSQRLNKELTALTNTVTVHRDKFILSFPFKKSVRSMTLSAMFPTWPKYSLTVNAP
jgi:translation initiation factor 6 (eIF-6)